MLEVVAWGDLLSYLNVHVTLIFYTVEVSLLEHRKTSHLTGGQGVAGE